jgi:hypothetical protein
MARAIPSAAARSESVGCLDASIARAARSARSSGVASTDHLGLSEARKISSTVAQRQHAAGRDAYRRRQEAPSDVIVHGALAHHQLGSERVARG